MGNSISNQPAISPQSTDLSEIVTNTAVLLRKLQINRSCSF